MEWQSDCLRLTNRGERVLVTPAAPDHQHPRLHEGTSMAEGHNTHRPRSLQVLNDRREVFLPALLARISKNGASGCWLWTGQQASGYGVLSLGSHRPKRCRAHRATYTLLVGPIPDGLHVLHRCDIPLCVNPSHLFLGTNQDNVNDMVAKRRHRSMFKRKIGDAHPQAKLSSADVVEIRRLSSEGVTKPVLAVQFGVSVHTISAIRNGRIWRDTFSSPRPLRPRHPNHPNAKLTTEQAAEIRQKHASGSSQLSLAREYGMSRGAIWFVVRSPAD